MGRLLMATKRRSTPNRQQARRVVEPHRPRLSVRGMIALGDIPIRDETSIVEARNKIRLLAEDLKFSATGATRLATITSEIGRALHREGGESSIAVGFHRKGEDFYLLLAFESPNGAVDIRKASNFFDSLRSYSGRAGAQTVEALKHIPDPDFRPTESFIATARERLMRLSRQELLEEVKRKNEELQESEAFSRGILENVATGVYLLQDGRFQYVNWRFEEISGHTRDELIGTYPQDYIHPEDRETVRTKAIEVLKGQSSLPYEFRFTRKDSQEIWVLDWVTSIQYKGERSVLGTLMDITERKRSEEQQRIKDNAIEHSLNAVAMSDMEGKITYLNQACMGLLGGQSKEELVGKPYWELLEPGQGVDIRDIAKSMIEREAWSGELVGRRKDGELLDVEVSSSIVKDERGNPIQTISSFIDITERKRAEQDLRLKENAIENSINAIAMSDMQGKITYVNQACLSLWGSKNKEELVGKPYWVLSYSEDIAKEVALAMLEKGAWEGEVVGRGKDGTEIHLQVASSVVRDDKGNPVGTISSFVDITERKKAEEALRQSEEHYSALVGNLTDAVFKFRDGVITWCNDRVEEIYGYPKDELLGMAAKFFYPGDISPREYAKAITRMIGEQGVVRGTAKFQRKDGRVVDIEYSLSQIPDRDPAELVAVARDVTDRKRIEEALRESEELSRGMLDTAATGIYLLHDGRFQYVNQTFEEMSGYTREELIEDYSLDYVHAEDRETVRTKAIEVLKGESSLPYEFRFLRKDSEPIWVLDWVTSIQYKGKRSVLGTLMDVTERKKAEDRIRHYTKRMEGLYAVAQAVSQTLDLDEVLDSALAKAVDVMGTDSGNIFLLDLGEKVAVLKAHRGMSDETMRELSTISLSVDDLERIGECKDPTTPLSGILSEATLGLVREAAERDQTESILTVPFWVRGQPQGLLSIASRDRREFSTDDIELLTAMGNEIAVAVENAQLLAKTRELSVTDELTGLYNRRQFYGVLEAEISRTLRYGGSFSLIMLDLDGFKEYNDRFGHATGDAILRLVAQTIRASLRETDAAFRYGGDEFTTVLPATDAERAEKIIDRVRAEWWHVLDGQQVIQQSPLGFSAGIAEFPHDAETADGLVFLADTALYHSKRLGGHRSTRVSDLEAVAHDGTPAGSLDQVYALAAAVDARDPLAYGHSKRVAAIANSMGKAIGLPRNELVKLHAGGLLHDIGKVGVPDSIITKPYKPEEVEWRIIRKHSTEGATIVSSIGELAPVAPLIRHHHEWYDGTGYPDGLKGEEIPLGARVIHIADAYDTMTTPRAYRQVISHEEACAELGRCAGTQFDPELVGVFCRDMEKPASRRSRRRT